MEQGSLNIGWRERQQQQIVKANHQLVKRIQMCKPTYDRREQLADAHLHDAGAVTAARAPR